MSSFLYLPNTIIIIIIIAITVVVIKITFILLVVIIVVKKKLPPQLFVKKLRKYRHNYFTWLDCSVECFCLVSSAGFQNSVCLEPLPVPHAFRKWIPDADPRYGNVRYDCMDGYQASTRSTTRTCEMLSQTVYGYSDVHPVCECKLMGNIMGLQTCASTSNTILIRIEHSRCEAIYLIHRCGAIYLIHQVWGDIHEKVLRKCGYMERCTSSARLPFCLLVQNWWNFEGVRGLNPTQIQSLISKFMYS